MTHRITRALHLKNGKKIKSNKIGTVSSMKKGECLPGPSRPSVLHYRGNLGESLCQPFPRFDLWDPYMHLTDWTYSNLHDTHLKGFFSQPYRKRLLIKHGLITHDEKVLCSRKQFNQYTRYMKTVQQSWEKLFVQKQKQLLKEFMLQELRGEVPEHVTVSDMKKWLIYKGRDTFRKMYLKFMKWNDPQCAELAWELNQQFQLEALEKEVIRELRLEGQDQHLLEDLSRSHSSRPLPVSTVFSISSSNESNSESTEDAASLVTTVENLHNLIRRVTTLTGEIKENLVPVLLELLQEECTASCSSTESSTDFLPVYSSREDTDLTDVISCRTSVSPVISGTATEDPCNSATFNSVSLSGSFSVYSGKSTGVFTSKHHSSDTLHNIISQSTATDPAKMSSTAVDSCGLHMPTMIPVCGGSASLLSLEIRLDLGKDIENPTTRDLRNESSLLRKADMLVLEVLNRSVAQMQLLPNRQMRDCCYNGPYMQRSQRSDTDSSIEEILLNLPSPPLSSPSSPVLITEGEVAPPLTESSKSYSMIGYLSSSHIRMISGDTVESALERVRSWLQIEGLLYPQYTSEEVNESSSCKSSESDSSSESPRCVSVGPPGSENDPGCRLIGGHNTESCRNSLHSVTDLEACTNEIGESALKSLMRTHGSQRQEPLCSLQCASIMSSCTTLKDTKVHAAFEEPVYTSALGKALSKKTIKDITGCDRMLCQSLTCPSFRSTTDESDLRNTLRKIILTCDNTCTQSDNQSHRSLISSLAGVVYQHVQDKCRPEIQISKPLDEYSVTKVDCSSRASSSYVKVISYPPSESVIDLLETQFGTRAKSLNLVKSAFKQLTKPIFEKLHIQYQKIQCTIDGSDSPSSAKPVTEHCNETVLRVVEIIITKIIMETFRISRSSPESASVLQEFQSVASAHPQRQFLLWFRSSIIESVMGQLFVQQKVIDVRDAARAENPAGSLGTTGLSTPAMPKMESTAGGSKPKKVKKVHAFFRRAWQAVKKTFCFGKRSNKICPYN